MNLTKDVVAHIAQITHDHPDLMASQMQRIIAMGKVNLPAMSAADITQAVDALGGVNLPPLQMVSWDILGQILSKRFPKSSLREFIQELEPLEAYLLLVCSELAGLSRQYPESKLKDDDFFPLIGRDQE